MTGVMTRTGPEGSGPGAATPRPASWRIGSGRERSPLRPDPARPGATAALTTLTLASATGLFRVFSTNRWLGPVALSIVAIHLLCWLLRRVRLPQIAAAPVVTLGIVLMPAWTLLGRYTTAGIPTGRTWHQAVSALGDLSSQFASMQPPVTPTRAFQLVAVLGAGVAAALGDWAAFRWRSPLIALTPGLAVFIFAAAAGVGPGRAAILGLELAAMCLFLIVERASGPGRVWFAGIHAGAGGWATVIGALVSAVAVVSGLALSPALAGRDGKALLGWRNGGLGQGGTRIVQNPLVDLRTRLTQFQNVPVFIVTSNVPSYWRLTSLNQFDGELWQSTGSYGGFGSRLPGAPPAGTAVRTARATFQIQQLASDWLPAQFNPVSVRGVRGVTYDPSTESLLAPSATEPSLQYSVTSYQRLDTLTATQLSSAPPLAKDQTVEANLQLPPIAGRITALAESLTAAAPTEYQKAMAIQDYLRGPSFRYSLDPPSDGSGTQAIYNFLFQTRTGYCQQFAGAYAVLARAAGLPTRLAIGFVQGDPTGTDTYQVHDRDAHTWPEVYFGPAYGWVPFEPTKGFGIPGTNGYNTIGPGGTTAPVSPATTTPPTTAPGSVTLPSGTPRTITPKTVPGNTISAAALHHSGLPSPWLLLIPGVVVAWPILVGAGPWLLRRRRRRRAAHAGSRSETLNAWDEVVAELTWMGVDRRPDETDDEFARRAAVALRRLGLEGGESARVERLAEMARRAAFAASVPDDLGVQAFQAARHMERSIRSLSGPGRRLARLWTLRPGTWARLVSALHPERL